MENLDRANQLLTHSMTPTNTTDTHIQALETHFEHDANEQNCNGEVKAHRAFCEGERSDFEERKALSGAQDKDRTGQGRTGK